MPRPRKDAEPGAVARTRRPPATPEEVENRLISIAYDFAEKQIKAGTASSQMVVHFLKLGSSTERLQQEKMILEKELLKARAEAVVSTAQSKELLEQAMKAFTSYQGADEEEFLD